MVKEFNRAPSDSALFSLLLIRIALIVLFYTAALLISVVYIQSIGSGIDIFNGLFLFSLVPVFFLNRVNFLLWAVSRRVSFIFQINKTACETNPALPYCGVRYSCQSSGLHNTGANRLSKIIDGSEIYAVKKKALNRERINYQVV